MPESEQPDTPTPQTPQQTTPIFAAPLAPPVGGAPTVPPAAPVPPASAPVPPAAAASTETPAPAASTVPPAPPASTAPSASGTDAPRPRSLAVPVIAAAIVAGLLGGGIGAGVTALAVSSQGAQPANSPGSHQTITVNNPDSSDVVTAVAAKAADSVVTINVAAGRAGGSGSGVILDEEGHVLTNTHVITLEGASADGQIEVTTADGRIFRATIVGLDPIVDLAVIKLIDPANLTPIEWGDSDALEVGDQVIAIGAPLGLSNTVTDGIVSALGRSIQIQSSAVPDSGDADNTPDDEQNGGQGPFDFWQFDQGPGQDQRPSSQSATISLPVIQTDAAINPGNSGGALLNDTGQLIGINVAIASTGSTGGSTAGSIGVGFSIPATLAQRVADELIAEGEASHGLLGATVSTATSADSDVVGGRIEGVTPGGAAEAAGLQEGDVVTRFNGQAITSSTDLTAQVRALAAGSTTTLEYHRNGAKASVEVTLGELRL